MSNRQLLADIQRRQRDLRMQALNPDKVKDFARSVEAYVRSDELEAFKDAITRLVAQMAVELEQIKYSADCSLFDTKKSIDNTITSETSRIRSEFAKKINEIDDALGTSIADLDNIKQSGKILPDGLIEKINKFVVQRSVSIPVTTDQGGLGTSIMPTAGQVPICNVDGTYSPGTVSGASLVFRAVYSVAVPTSAGSTPSTDYVYFVSGTTTITLPTAVGNTNRYTIKNTGSNTVTIATTSSQTIDGSASASILLANTSLDLISDNANWRIV